MSNIFKAYDVRGIYPEEINKDNAYKIGFATVKFLQAKNSGKRLNLVVGEDARIASPELRGAVIDALTKAGVDVFYIGQCTTPLFYFSVNKLNADGGLMVTASHNPPQYGGLKIVGPDSRPIGSESGLKEIEKISEGEFNSADQAGTIKEVDLVSDYINFLIKESGINVSSNNNIKLVIDAGNGMTPSVLDSLIKKLGLPASRMYFEIDCNFPNHSPDISKAEALNDLRNKVMEERANLGVAFDGDGDRVMFVDNDGKIIRAEFILALLFEDKSSLFKKPKTVYDLRISRSVKELLGDRGIKSRPGHSMMKKVMRDHDADLGGELSGHFFFKEMKYVESSILVMLKLLKIMSKTGKPLSDLVRSFEKYYHSGEINIDISKNLNIKTSVIQILKDKYGDGIIDELDGITVEYLNWWFNVRASNTEPLLRLVVEAETKEMMDQKAAEISEVIKNAA